MHARVYRRVEALQELQAKHDEVEAQFRKERAELEAKYEKLYGGCYHNAWEMHIALPSSGCQHASIFVGRTTKKLTNALVQLRAHKDRPVFLVVREHAAASAAAAALHQDQGPLTREHCSFQRALTCVLVTAGDGHSSRSNS